MFMKFRARLAPSDVSNSFIHVIIPTLLQQGSKSDSNLTVLT